MARIKNITHLVGLLLVFVAVANASIKWRRVTRTTPASIHSTTTETTPSATKTPVTWRRSTLSRRSTTEQEITKHEEEHEKELEEEDIDVADSREDVSIQEEDTEQEPAIKPFVPGSRPGFWFDSSRKRKPSALLRPGSRKSSLFPTKPSTLATPNAISESQTPASVSPVTTPRSIHLPRLNHTSNSKSKTFGRNSSTKPPVAFKRRLKATKSSRTTTTTAAPETEDLENDEELPQVTEVYFDEKEKDSVSINNGKILEENTKSKPYKSVRLPGIRRRKNGTRASPRTTTTTAAPEMEDLENDEELLQVTEVDFDVKEKDSVSIINDKIPDENTKSKPYESVRLPGIRRRKNSTRIPWRKEGSRFSPNSTSSPLSNISRTTPIPNLKGSRTTPTSITTSAHGFARSTRKPTTVSRDKSRTKLNRTSLPQRIRTKSTPVSTSPSTSSTKGFDKKPTKVIKGPTNYLRNRNVHKFNRLRPKPIPEESEEEEYNVVSTTPEPNEEFEIIVNTTQELDIYSKSTVEPFYITKDYGELVTAISEIGRKKGRVPERTTTSTPVTEEHEVVEEFEKLKSFEVNDTKNDVDSEEEVYENNSLKFSAVDETLTYPESISRHSTQHHRSTTLKPSPTIAPFSHTIDPGNNAYVVWSLGQGGSGWSYEKQGGQVKWSAQNSQAEGDRWSVQGTEEKGTSSSAVWTPVNTTSTWNNKKSESVTSLTQKDKQVYYPNSKSGFDNTNYWTPVTYMPKIPYRNETILKFTTPEDIKTLSPSDIKDYSPFPPGIRDFSPIVFQNTENNISAGKFEHSVHSLDIPEFNSNPDYQNSRTDGHYINNQTSSQNNPHEPENGVTFSFQEGSNGYELTNVSDVDEYLTQTPQFSIDWNLPTTINTPVDNFYGSELENQFSKSTDPSFEAEDVTPVHIVFPESGFVKEFPPTVDSPTYFNGGFNQQARDLSGIPPELAKAVVDAKRWTVVGTGGAEGWSLLGEDGQLEWKIHNIDGRWSVTSGDQLLKLPLQVPSPSQEAPHDDSNQKDNLEVENINEKSRLNSPKIWKLEDDYNKWKVLSAEGGIQVESPEDQLTPNREYDYDQNAELEDDYYDDEDEYDGIGDNDFTPPSFYETFDDRPIWGTGENKMIRRYPGAKAEYSTPSFGGGIESVNTKEDAIAAWKSLLIDQNNWKVSKENFRENPRTTVSSKYSLTSPSRVSSEWKMHSTTTLKPKGNFEKDSFKELFPLDRSIGNNKEVQDKGVFQDGIHYNKNAELKNIDSYVQDFEDFEENKENENRSERPKHLKFHHKDHAKIDTLINKLENIQKGSKGRAVVDLAQLLKIIKTNRNSTSGTPKLKGTSEVKNQTRESDFILSRDKTVEYQKVRQQKEESKQQRPQKNNSNISSEIQIDRQLETYERYANNLNKNRITPKEQFDKIVKEEVKNPLPKINLPLESIAKEYEQISKDQIAPVKKFDKDRTYYKQLGNVGHRNRDDNPSHIRNRQNDKTSEESEEHEMKLHLKNKIERFHIKNSEYSENNQNYPYINVNNKQTLSNSEENPDERRTPVRKNHEKEKYVIDVDSSSEEYKNRLKTPHGLTNYRRKAGDNTYRRINNAREDIGNDNTFTNDDRNVPINEPKRKHNGFQTALGNSYHNDEPNLNSQINLPENDNQNVKENTLHSNRDSSEKYAISNKYHTSRNRRKRPHTVKSRRRNRGRPGHSKMSGSTRTSHDSSAENFASNNRKRPQEPERYEENNHPEIYEENIRPQKNEENRRPQRNEENIRPQRNEENRRPQRNEENRRPQRNEENTHPQRNEGNRRPERYERKRRPEGFEEYRRPEKNDKVKRPDRYKERRHPERYDEKIHPELYEEDRRYEGNDYDSSPEFTTMTQRQKVRSNKYNQASPVVISSETEIEDNEDGSKKNRKIIVIDYAGRQKKKSPIDRKDLELIIRSVKNRRSEIMEDASNENHHQESTDRE